MASTNVDVLSLLEQLVPLARKKDAALSYLENWCVK